MNIISMLNRALSNRVPRYMYARYKKWVIISALKSGFNPCNAKKPFGYLLDERIVEYPWLFSKIEELDGRLLDAGSVLNFDYLLSHPAMREKKIFISTLAPENHAYWNRGISYVYEDMRDICYKDGLFDCIVCLSVIEHVGMDNTKLYTNDQLKKENTTKSYLSVISELHRILKPGGVLLMSMPYGESRDYTWLQTFDGSMVDSIINTFRPAAYTESYFRYIKSGWTTSSRADSAACQYFDYHDHSRSYRDDRAIAAEGVVLLELRK